MPKSNRKINKKRSSLIIGVIIVTAALTFLIVRYFSPSTPPPHEEQFGWENASKEINQQTEKQTSTTAGNDTSTTPLSEQAIKTPCQRVTDELQNFFSELNKKEYITAYELGVPIEKHIDTIITKLLDNPPIINEETSDLFTVLNNTAHFYKILGPKDLSLIKDVLSHESASIEHLMAIFYEWSQLSGCTAPVQAQTPLVKMYEYSAFFLQTLGGQSYLFRRDSRMRILTKYYCVLILDKINTQSQNKYNIDEIYTLNSVMEDIKNTESLENQDEYLTTLSTIKSRLASPR